MRVEKKPLLPDRIRRDRGAGLALSRTLFLTARICDPAHSARVDALLFADFGGRSARFVLLQPGEVVPAVADEH